MSKKVRVPIAADEAAAEVTREATRFSRARFLQAAGLGVGAVAAVGGVGAVAGPVDDAYAAAGIGQDFVVTDSAFAGGAKGDGTTDDRAAIRAAVNACRDAGGGRVVFPAGVYYLGVPKTSDDGFQWGSGIPLPANLPRTMVLSGYGATIKLGDTVGRFLEFDVPSGTWPDAAHAVYRNFIIEGFDIDANDVTVDLQTGVRTFRRPRKVRANVIIGTFINAGTAGDYTGIMHINLENIHLRDIRAYNIETDTSTDAGHSLRYGVNLSTMQVTVSESICDRVRHITCRNVRMEGGNRGITIVGGRYDPNNPKAPVAGDTNIEVDDIVVDGCYHNACVGPAYRNSWAPGTQFDGANFHLVGSARGGTIIVEDCQGFGSGDVGIEVDQPTTGLVADCVVEDAFNDAFYLVNYNTPMGGRSQQTVTFRGCHARRVNDSLQNGTAFGVPYFAPYGYGSLLFEDCSWYKSTATCYTFEGIWIRDSAGAVHAPVNAVAIRGFRLDSSGFTTGTGTVPRMIHLRVDGRAVLDDIRLRYKGEWTGGSGLTIVGVSLEGNGDYFVNDLECDFAITNKTADGLRGICIGSMGSFMSTLNVVIQGMRVVAMTGATALNPIYVSTSANLTLPGGMSIHGCDFQTVSGGKEINFTDETLRPKAAMGGNLFAVTPPVIAAVTLDTNKTYRNADPYPETVVVQGGKVTKITVKRGTLAVDVYSNTTASAVSQTIDLGPGDSVTLAYTTLPTIKKIPLWW